MDEARRKLIHRKQLVSILIIQIEKPLRIACSPSQDSLYV